MQDKFDIILFLGIPAVGKSEIVDYLKMSHREQAIQKKLKKN